MRGEGAFVATLPSSPVRIGEGFQAMARRLPRLVPPVRIPTGDPMDLGTCWRRRQSGANSSPT